MANDMAARVLVAAEVATGLLGWAPDRFWRATPAELATALRGRLGPAAAAPLDGTTLRRMQERLGDG